MSKLVVLGLGRAATAWYVSELHRRYALQRDTWSTCPLVLHQLDFQTINPHLPDGYEVLKPLLMEVFQDLHVYAPEAVLVPNITLHAILDRLDPVLWKWVHPVHLATEALQSGQAYILGTRHTWGQGYLSEAFGDAGIAPLEPPAHVVTLSDALRLDVDAGTATDLQIQAWALEVVKLAAEAPVVLACTELSMAASALQLENTVDLADLQLNAAVKVVQSA